MILKNLERKIWEREGFQVKFVRLSDKRDVRSDTQNVGNWGFNRRAKDAMTVSEFIKRRLGKFRELGWTGEVVLGDGNTAHGGMLLGTVRYTYEE